MKNYLIFLPEIKGSFEEEWRQCLNKIKDTRSDGTKLIKLNIFTDLEDYSTYLKVSKEIGDSIKNIYKDQCPAFNVTVHPPEKPWKVAVEAGFLETDDSRIVNKVFESLPYVVRISDSGKEVWAGGLGAGFFPEDTRKAASVAFNQMKAILENENMSYDHIVRQWNYIGNILEVRNMIQNYQVFNEVRSENYNQYRSANSYPAATGVGIKFGGVILDFYAVKAEDPIKIIAIENPDQVNPYSYGQEVLVGIPNGGRKAKQPPQFERAMLISDNMSSTIFISGTASIVGQKTIGRDDIYKQTIVTIENIKKLSDSQMINNLVSSVTSEKLRLILLRVYIKNQEDFATIKTICHDQFPGVPAVFIEADICRDDLLVEIEAEYAANS